MCIKSSKLLKNVLSTASIIALSSGFCISSPAVAVGRTSQNAVSDISTPTDWLPNGFVSGDAMIFGGDHTINAISLGNFNVSYIDSGAASVTGTVLIKNTNLYVGGATGAPVVTLKMDTGGSLTFATLDASPFANIYPGLNIVDFNGVVGSTLTLSNNVPITLSTSFLSTGGDAGKIIIDNNREVTFNGSLSDTPGTLLESMTINSGAEARFQFNKTIINIDGPGNFVLASDPDKEINSNIGSSSVKINTVIPTIGGSASTTKTTLKSGYSVYANEFKLYGEGEIGDVPLDSSIFIMEDNSFIDAPITTLPYSTGDFSGGTGVKYSEVEVLSNATIIQDIGTSANKMNDIKFLGAPGSVVNLSGDLHSDNIALSQPNVILGNDLVFDGQTIADSTTISLGNNTLSFDNASSSKFIGNPTVKFTVDDTKHGHFLVLDGNLDLNTATSFNVTLTDVALILPPEGPVGQSYLIFQETDDGNVVIVDNAKAKANFLITKQNPFVTWSYDNGVVKRVRLPQDEVDDIIEDNVTGGGGSSTTVENAIRIADPNNVGDASALFQRLTSLLTNGQDLVSALNALQPVIVEAAEQISEAVDMALSTIGNRLKSSIIQTFSIAQDDSTQGIAAGDDDYAHGAWSSVFWGSVTQKARGESPGFKSKTVGYVVGADTKISEERTIGMALSYADNDVKHKDTNDGDTSRVKAYTASIYGVQEINDKWFLQAMGSFSRNKISNREQRFFQDTPEIAKGDFYTNAYGLNALAGYNKLISDRLLTITTFGLEYLVLGKSKYKETGTTNQNFTISKATDHKLDAIVGTSLSYETNFHKYRVVPEVHGNISYDLLNKSPKVTVVLDGLSAGTLVKKTAEQERIFYNLGTSVSASKGAVETSAGYDFYFTKKYTAHQGALKVRLNF